MELYLNRIWRTNNSTISTLCIGAYLECFILEDKDRGLTQDMSLEEIEEKKIYGKTCIPAGRYEVKITWSNRFKRMLPVLIGVPGFTGIRIHSGNTPFDTLGCLLTGKGRAVDKVTESMKAFEELFAKLENALKNERVFITIE